MSKIKDELARIPQKESEQYVSFMEWIYDQKNEVNVNDTNEVEEDSKEPSAAEALIVPANTLKPVNNMDYNPTRSIR